MNPPTDTESLAFRAWVADLVREYDREASAHPRWDREHRRHVRDLHRLLATLEGDPGRSAKDCIRALIAAGLTRYAGVVERLPSAATASDVIFDLAGVALWPIVISPSLPRDWIAALQQMSSPQLARLVAHARTSRSRGVDLGLPSFLRSLADESLASGLYQLFDDMSDPKRGGSVLTALAVASDQPMPPLRESRRMLAWVLGAAAAGIVGNRADALAEQVWDGIVGGHPQTGGSSSHGGGHSDDPGTDTGSGHHQLGQQSHRNHGQGLLAALEGLFQ